MRDFEKIIYDDVKWLFFHWELEKCEVSKSVEPDREWDYILKLKMGKTNNKLGGVTKNEDETINCIPPWSIEELNEHLDFDWWIDETNTIRTLHRKVRK